MLSAARLVADLSGRGEIVIRLNEARKAFWSARVVFAGALALVILSVIAGCGRVNSPGDVASGAYTNSPQSSPSPSPSAVLQAGACTGPVTSSSSTTTKPLGLDSITLTIPTAWSDHTNEVTGAGALLFIKAPASYGPDNPTFMLQSIPGPRRGSTSHEQALEDAASFSSLGPAGPVSDCAVGGEQASFYEYHDSAGNDVFRLLVLHSPTSISSQGPLDPQAAADIRAILGSWGWGTPLYDPNS